MNDLLSRRFRLSRTGSVAALITASMFLPSLAEADQIVHPTGAFPEDVHRVQTAIDAGGTVVLKASDELGTPTAFNFGPPEVGSGSVELSADVALVGESTFLNVTTIRGGYFPVRGYQPVRSTVEGIYFDGPGGAAIMLLSSLGARIAGNTIERVQPFSAGPFPKAVGLWLTGLDPRDLSGDVVIENNVIAGVLAENGDGIALVHLAADVYVTGNEIYDVGNVGILVNGNTQPIAIHGNHVEPGPGRDGYFDFGNGILLGQSFDVSPLGPTVLSHNTIVCDNPLADGIVLFASGNHELDGAILEHNVLVIRRSFFGGITLADGVSNTLVANNTIRGGAAYALGTYALGFGKPVQASNAFIGNNVATFDAGFTDAFFGATTEQSVLVGNGGTVVDLGTDNRITGLTTLGADNSPGPSVREALAAKLY